MTILPKSGEIVPKASKQAILRKKDDRTMKDTGRIVLFVVVLVTFMFPAMPQATIYRWQDSEGNTHFTDDLTRVPPEQRERVEVENLPEEPVNITPAPPLPAGTPTQDASESKDEYAECQKRLKEEKERWTRQLEEDQDRLVELNKMIHRSTTSRNKNEFQRERVAVKERIEQAEQALRDRVPPLEQECEAIRYWHGED